MRPASLAWTALVLLASASSAKAADPPSLVDVGAAKVDVTPGYPVRLSGYLSRKTPSVGVSQHIFAKALAIGSDRQGPVVLVSVDNLGVGEEVVEEVALRLRNKAKLPRARFCVASSHTHCAPCTTNVAPNLFGHKIAADEQAVIDRYTRELTDNLERVCLDALRARQPGRLSWAQGSVGFAMNRRTKGGPVDHSLPALRVTDPDGALRAVLVNYACHCTTLDPVENTISGDWAGFAQAAIEADHPGAIALTVIGCGADANPTRRLEPTAAADHGRALADELKRMLKGDWSALAGPPETAFERFTLPFDTLPTREQLQTLVKADGPAGYNASVQLAKLDRGEPLQSQLNYSAQAWKFGDTLLMVFLPGEVVVDYVLRLKKEFDPARLWVSAYANDDPCYIPSERILREGGYEGGGAMMYYNRPTRLKPGVEQVIIDAVHHVAGDRFKVAEANGDDAMPPALAPKEALATIRVKPGLRVETVVAEPLVQSPVAVDFGADGAVWVAEMRDYPTGIDGHWKPGGMIRKLEDRDHDGTYETATVFAKDLPFPTGVMAWRKGVLICAAPDILYAEDTNGDGVADKTHLLFRGFATENYQARVNGLSFGIDNWVYGANGLIGGTIHGSTSGQDVNIGGRDFRIKPDTGAMEPASGLSQQGRIHDDWGDQFGGNNSVLIQHYPLPDHYSRRNPRVAAPSPAVFLGSDPDPSLLFPASRTLARYNHPESANRVTSACGPGIYRDVLLGDEYVGNVFTCEPVHNLVRRTVLDADGATFRGRRAEDEQFSEFLASTDPWFRPVQARTAPDGSLWIVDMYRAVIEHPRWISPEKLATLDIRAGADRGRIYRVAPAKAVVKPVPVLSTLSTPDLARAIDSPNGALRENVQRLLFERGDRSAVPVLRELAAGAKTPQTRAQALGALDGLGAINANVLMKALADKHPGVRRQAVRLSEPFLETAPALAAAVAALVDDPQSTVRFQVALSLGATSDGQAGRALGKIAARDSGDPWIRAAVLSSATRHAPAILEAIIARGTPPAALIEPLLATLTGAHDKTATARALAAISEPGRNPASWRIGAIAELLDTAGDPTLATSAEVRPMIVAARAIVANPKSETGERAVALRLLGRIKTQRDQDRSLLAALLNPSEPAELQLSAVRALSRLDDEPAAEAILSRWSALGPSVRAAALDSLLARPSSTNVLLTSLESKKLAPGSIDATHRQRLLSKGERAARIFQGQAIGPRSAVLAAYQPAKSMTGDPAKGKVVFAKTCAACHKFGGQGHEVGPDIAALTDTSADALMTAILDPNREVDARYAGYSAALKDGRVLSGLIASETASAITLKRQEGQSDAILREDLDEMKTEGKSLMPEGLENDLKPADLADVIAYVASGAARPKVLEGNKPGLVVQAEDGVVRLPASSAEIYGPTLTFETQFDNLGYWQSPDDHASWTFQLDRPATFTVTMEWACPEESAGNVLRLKFDQTAFRAVIGATGEGTWSKYRSIFVTEVTLPAGKHRLDARPDGPVKNAVLDLRGITLTPRGDAVYRK